MDLPEGRSIKAFVLSQHTLAQGLEYGGKFRPGHSTCGVQYRFAAHRAAHSIEVRAQSATLSSSA